MSDATPTAAGSATPPPSPPETGTIPAPGAPGAGEEYVRKVEEGYVLMVAVEKYRDLHATKDREKGEFHQVAVDAVGRRIRAGVVRHASDAEIRAWRLGEDTAEEVGVAATLGATENQTFGVDPAANPKAARSSELAAAGHTVTTAEPMSSMATGTGAAADTPVLSPLRASHTEVATDPAVRDAAMGANIPGSPRTALEASEPEAFGATTGTAIGPGESDASRLATGPTDQQQQQQQNTFAVQEPPKPFREMTVAEVEGWLEKNGFDQSTIKGTGANGNVLLADRVKAAESWYKQYPPKAS